MKKEKNVLNSQLNGTPVEGIAYLQPGCNPWIGLFKVDIDFFDVPVTQWIHREVTYEGPFYYRDKLVSDRIDRAEGKIIFLEQAGANIIINVEGISSPECELQKTIRFAYNCNLPVF